MDQEGFMINYKENRPTAVRQHYVWQHYLRAWETGGSLFCHRGGKTFSAGTKNIAVEKHFYRFEALSRDERAFALIVTSHRHPELLPIYEEWLNLRDSPFFYDSAVRALQRASNVSENVLNKLIDEGEESIHSRIEGTSSRLLKCVRQRDLSFLNNTEEFVGFVWFLLVQYFRTKNVRRSTANVIEFILEHHHGKWGDVDPVRTSSAMQMMGAIDMSYSLVCALHEIEITLLTAEDGSQFITSDQPVVNLAALSAIEGRGINSVDLFYPVSPGLALRLRRVTGRPRRHSEEQASADVVGNLNNIMARMSHECLFGMSAEALGPYERMGTH